GCELDCRRSQVLFQALQLPGARDGNDPRLLGKQPGKRYLRRSRFLPLRALAKETHQYLIRLASLRRKAREIVAEVGAVECGVLVDLAREEAPAQRTVGNEADT